MREQKMIFAVSMAWTLSLFLTPIAQAENVRPAESTKQTMSDIALNANGQFQGQLVNAEGKTVAGAEVIVFKGLQPIAKAVSNKQGTFSISGLKNGIYRIESPGHSRMCRVWSNQVAPPTAKQALVMVQGDMAARGQYGYMDPIGVGAIVLGIAGVTISAITLGKVNDLEDDINKLQSP